MTTSKRSVERALRGQGLCARRRRKFVATTRPDPAHPVERNVLARDFTATAPNQRWVTDITYIWTDEGWAYLAAILDLFSRCVVGWALSNSLSTELPLAALDMAVKRRRPAPGLLHHSDRGCQYTSADYRRALGELGVTVSMSRKGNCWDNTVAESFFATIKQELVHGRSWPTRLELRGRTAVFEHIEAFYNRRRLHSSLDYSTPTEVEDLYAAKAANTVAIGGFGTQRSLRIVADTAVSSQTMVMQDRSTLQAMQGLLDRFHELADAILRHNYPELRSLKSRGLNAEGKPIQGTPDSYVGSSPEECSIAVEHTTTKLESLAAKFEEDYGKVVEKCPGVKRIFLCTNRPRTAGIADTVIARAATDGKSLEIVWGEDIAQTLDDHRQDLREEYLSIPLGRLTQHSLIPAIRAKTQQAVATFLDESRQAGGGHLRRRPVESQFLRLRPTRLAGTTLVVAEAGLGKTTWSAAEAERMARSNPAIWMPAKLIGSEGLNVAIVEAVYGSNGSGRVDELANLLQSADRLLVLFLDAIDEHHDYGLLLQKLHEFQARSRLARRTHVVLTCRAEALPLLEETQSGVLPSSGRGQARLLGIDPLREKEAEHLLSRIGAEPHAVAAVMQTLPAEFLGNPLYLKLACNLLNAGDLPERSTNWIDAFAQHYLREVVRRLRRDGIGPSPLAVQTALGSLALAALQDDRGADLGQFESHAVIAPDVVGESTFLERTVQSGLLVRNGERVRFCHSLMCEYFAAVHVVSDTVASTEQKVAQIARLPGRASIARFAVERDAALLAEFLEQHPTLVESFDPAALSDSLREALLNQAETLLQSRYPSARQAALRILTTIRTGRANGIAINWFNDLPKEEKVQRILEAAQLFLGLELRNAVSIAAMHVSFQAGSDMAWFEPGFARVIDRLSIPYRRVLADYAMTAIARTSPQTQEEARCTTILAYLRDPRLIERLRAKAKTEALAQYEHRALVHFNTDEAMAIYAESRQHHYAIIDALPTDDGGSKRSAAWHQLVFKQLDVVLFPHDAFVRLIKDALKSPDENDQWFGIENAETVEHPDLVEEYAAAVTRGPNPRFMGMTDMVSNLVTSMASDDIVRLYHRVGSVAARRLILAAAGNVPSEDTEQLLLSALQVDELVSAACSGIARCRCDRAGPALHDLLQRGAGRSELEVVKALGRLHYEAALGELIDRLATIPPEYGDDDHQSSNAEYFLIGAIGEMGGQVAWDALGERFRARPNVRILSFLFDAHDPYTTKIVRSLLEERPEVGAMLGRAIRRSGELRNDVTYIDDGLIRAEFSDDVILDALLAAARKGLGAPQGSLQLEASVYSDCQAIARFDSPKVELFLREVAESMEDSAEEVDVAVNFARNQLARRGDVRWTRFMIECEVSFITHERWMSSKALSALETWPRAMVREVLRERLANEPARRGVWLYCLLPFATSEDHELMRQHLDTIEVRLADMIREKLPSA